MEARGPMLNNYVRVVKIGGGQHGDVYLCTRLEGEGGKIPVVSLSAFLNFWIGEANVVLGDEECQAE